MSGEVVFLKNAFRQIMQTKGFCLACLLKFHFRKKVFVQKGKDKHISDIKSTRSSTKRSILAGKRYTPNALILGDGRYATYNSPNVHFARQEEVGFYPPPPQPLTGDMSEKF